MNNEKDVIINQDSESQSIVARILNTIYKKIPFILIVVIISAVIGVIYGKTRNREYISYHDVSYVATNTATFQKNGENFVLDDDGNYAIKANDTSHINTASKYYDAVKDFIKTGVVVDRANFYYNQYMQIYNTLDESKKGSFLTEYCDIIAGTKFTKDTIKNKIGKKLEISYYFGQDISGKQLYKTGIFTLKAIDESGKLICENESKTEFKFNFEGSKNKTDYSIKNIKYPNTLEKYVAGFNDDDLLKNKGKKFNVIVHRQYKNNWESITYNNLVFSHIVDTQENKLLVFNNENGEKVLALSRYDVPKCDDALSYVDSIYTVKAVGGETYNYSYTRQEINVSNIYATSNKTSELNSYIYTVGYKDKTLSQADLKASIVILAVKQEVQEYAEGYDFSKPRTGAVEYKYFNIVENNLVDMGAVSNEFDISTRKLLVIFSLGGFALSLLIIYLLSLFDVTMTNKQELEKIVGSPVLSYIDEVKEEKK